MGIERWARADDGTFVRIVIEGGSAAEPTTADVSTLLPAAWPTGDGDSPDWWPPLGLTALAAPPVGGGAGAALVHVDLGVASWRDRLESDLGLVAAEHLGRFVAVHAAVIEAEGRLLVLPGPSFTGKSSLCAAAVSAGHLVWSDEYALVDPATGEVTGWPRRIKLRGVDGRAHRIEIGSDGVREGRRADQLVFIAFDPAVEGALDARPITPGDAAMRLLENTVCAQARPGDALSAATALAKSCPAKVGRRGAADAAIAALAG